MTKADLCNLISSLSGTSSKLSLMADIKERHKEGNLEGLPSFSSQYIQRVSTDLANIATQLTSLFDNHKHIVWLEDDDETEEG